MTSLREEEKTPEQPLARPPGRTRTPRSSPAVVLLPPPPLAVRASPHLRAEQWAAAPRAWWPPRGYSQPARDGSPGLPIRVRRGPLTVCALWDPYAAPSKPESPARLLFLPCPFFCPLPSLKDWEPFIYILNWWMFKLLNASQNALFIFPSFIPGDWGWGAENICFSSLPCKPIITEYKW